MKARIPVSVALLLQWTLLSNSGLADPPKIHKLEVQKVGQTNYFRVLLECPEELSSMRPFGWPRQLKVISPALDSKGTSTTTAGTGGPRLLPQDGKTMAVYLVGINVLALDDDKVAPMPPERKKPIDPDEKPNKAPDPAADEGTRYGEQIEFMGKVQNKAGKARLLLQYPVLLPGRPTARTAAKLLEQQVRWVEVELTLDFSKATKVKPPAGPRKAPPKDVGPAAPGMGDDPPSNDDLEGAWAASQARYFAEHESPDFGFYRFARFLTMQKYNLPIPTDDFTPAAEKPEKPANNPEKKMPREPVDEFFFHRRLYEITTGTAAITDFMAMNRLRNPSSKKPESRSIDVHKLPGLMTGDHSWAKLLAGKKPAAEPLAKLVPHDNYYVHFKTFGKFLETGTLLDEWGTALSRVLEGGGRDYQLRERLEQQICLKATKLSRLFGPAVVRSIAFTGSDPYLKEGSDFTILFHVANNGHKAVFLASAETHLKEARAHFAGKLKEDRQTYLDVAIESCVSPLREVSMHRANFGDFIIYSNSLAGIRRVIDVHKGKAKSLAESPDFQYMRSVFPADDPLEDGFVFISDGFIRNLVGPALRIKERRRLDALTSLSMINNAALFTAWETGLLPASHKDLLAYTGLKAEQLFTAGGDTVSWNAEHNIAHSAQYNTLTFATPLIEMAIDKITPSEEQEYRQFIREYSGQWRRFFDPIGMRIKLGQSGATANGEPRTTDHEVRWETCILPQVPTSQYHDLRRLAGDGAVKFDAGTVNPRSIVQFMSHLSPSSPERGEIGEILKSFSPDIPGLDWMGSWFSVRLDDSPIYAKLARRVLMREIDRGSVTDYDEDVRLFFQIPLTVGMEIRNPLVFAGILAAVRKAVDDALPDTLDWQPLKEAYKGTAIVRIQARSDGPLGAFCGRNGNSLAPSLYYALINGAWYVSLRQECIQDEIDAALARNKSKGVAAKSDVVTSLHVKPHTEHARDFLNAVLEWETNRQAVANTDLLMPLYRGKLVAAGDDGAALQNAAVKYLGFMPVSPDKSPYLYDAVSDEVVNKRHGNVRRPKLQDAIDADGPLAQLLEQLRTVRVDVRFREHGLHSVVTFTRK